MAKSRSTQWFPSVGVLAAAIVAALLAVFLVNVYIQSQINKYRKGAIRVLVLAEPVQQGKEVAGKVRSVAVPEKFAEAFQTALRERDKNLLVTSRRTAPRDMARGEVLWARDFIAPAGTPPPINVREGYQLVSLPIEPTEARNLRIQPGSFVILRAQFDDDPDPKKADPKTYVVIPSVQVRTVEGRTTFASSGGGQSYNEIGIEVRESQAHLLMRVRDVMTSKHFTIALTSRPTRTGEVDSRVSDVVVDKFLQGTPAPPVDFPLN